MSFLKSTRSDRNIYGKDVSPFWSLFILAIITSMVWIALPSSGLSHSVYTPIIRYLAPYVIGLLLILSVITSFLKINKQW